MLPYAGIKIIPTSYWPQVVRGTETIRFKADPIICWLAKLFPILPYVEAEYPKLADSDPILMRYENIIYCSHAQAQALMKEVN